MSGLIQAVLEQAKRLTAQERSELIDALLRLDSDQPVLDRAFTALWADSARNAVEAELDRQADLDLEVIQAAAIYREPIDLTHEDMLVATHASKPT